MFQSFDTYQSSHTVNAIGNMQGIHYVQRNKKGKNLPLLVEGSTFLPVKPFFLSFFLQKEKHANNVHRCVFKNSTRFPFLWCIDLLSALNGVQEKWILVTSQGFVVKLEREAIISEGKNREAKTQDKEKSHIFLYMIACSFHFIGSFAERIILSHFHQY